MQSIDFSTAIVAFTAYDTLRRSNPQNSLKVVRAANRLKHELNLCFAGSPLPLKFFLIGGIIAGNFPFKNK